MTSLRGSSQAAVAPRLEAGRLWFRPRFRTDSPRQSVITAHSPSDGRCGLIPRSAVASGRQAPAGRSTKSPSVHQAPLVTMLLAASPWRTGTLDERAVALLFVSSRS